MHIGAEPPGLDRDPGSCRLVANPSHSGSATSGGAAATQLGRRPRVVSPYNVNWLTTRAASSDVEQCAVHDPFVVVEDPQVPNFVRQP